MAKTLESNSLDGPQTLSTLYTLKTKALPLIFRSPFERKLPNGSFLPVLHTVSGGAQRIVVTDFTSWHRVVHILIGNARGAAFMQDFILVIEARIHYDERLDFHLGALVVHRAFCLWWRRVLRVFLPLLLLHHLQILVVLLLISKVMATRSFVYKTVYKCIFHGPALRFWRIHHFAFFGWPLIFEIFYIFRNEIETVWHWPLIRKSSCLRWIFVRHYYRGLIGGQRRILLSISPTRSMSWHRNNRRKTALQHLICRHTSL